MKCWIFPADIGAAAFPLAGRGQRGLLMMNPGHIDPGYEGKLWFSFINLVGRVSCCHRGITLPPSSSGILCAGSERPWKGRRGPEVAYKQLRPRRSNRLQAMPYARSPCHTYCGRIVADHMTEVRSEVTQLKNDLLIDLEKPKGYVMRSSRVKRDGLPRRQLHCRSDAEKQHRERRHVSIGHIINHHRRETTHQYVSTSTARCGILSLLDRSDGPLPNRPFSTPPCPRKHNVFQSPVRSH